jgi:DNA-binding response OmpR family regulator
MALILVVDDDRNQRAVAAHALGGSGHEVIEAADGTQGLEAARTRRPDLIVCDVVMPGISGFEFVTALRQEEGISDLPVIMLTSMSERAHMRTGMTSGADDYLAKPFSFAELNEAVTALLSKRKALHDGLVASLGTSFIAALDEQREILASQYEKRFITELSGRWDQVDETNTELRHADAIVMQVDIFGPLLARIAASADAATTVRKAYQSARDALRLFSAQHVLPAGNDLVAIFVSDDAESVRVDAPTRALKSAFALRRGVRAALQPVLADGGSATGDAGQVTIALHRGAVTLLRMSDPLHGDPDSVLATGDTVAELAVLREFARGAGWPVACSNTAARGLGDKLVFGRSAQVPQPDRSKPPIGAVEITALA